MCASLNMFNENESELYLLFIEESAVGQNSTGVWMSHGAGGGP